LAGLTAGIASVQTLWLVNGHRTGLDPSDRGVAYGDGLFETMAALDGRVRYLDYHFERLEDGCRRLAIPPPDAAAVRQEIQSHCPLRGRAVVKLIVTRGPGARGYGPPPSAQPTRILSISEWPARPAAHYTRGIRVRVCDLRLGDAPALAGLKHLSRLEQVLAAKELAEHGDAEQGLVLDTRGHVVGGTSTNVFCVRDGALATPALTRNGVRGVMRRVVIETAEKIGVGAVERDLTLDELHAADELFMTNALIGIWPVAKLGEARFAVGRVTLDLIRRLGCSDA
jgi:4-amino-4-deoxychorismate lyase